MLVRNQLPDSGASYSPVHYEYIILKDVKPLRSTILTSADDTGLSVKGIVTAPVILNSLNAPHSFIVVYNLSAPVIVGCDFCFQVWHDPRLWEWHIQYNHHDAKPEEFDSQNKCLNMLVLDNHIP